ncbi:hypothetical protein FJ366_04085 [Candidatus Dependentiae bacterium]|nr:hypothetical protein [Candidatus Dependentiae bacterium]
MKNIFFTPTSIFLCTFFFATQAFPSSGISILNKHLALAWITIGLPFIIQKKKVQKNTESKTNPEPFVWNYQHLEQITELFKKYSIFNKLFWINFKRYCSKNKTFSLLISLQTILLCYDLYQLWFQKEPLLFCKQSEENLTTQENNSCLRDLEFQTPQGPHRRVVVCLYSKTKEDCLQFPKLSTDLMLQYQTGQHILLPVGGIFKRGIITSPLVIFFNKQLNLWEECPYPFSLPAQNT